MSEANGVGLLVRKSGHAPFIRVDSVCEEALGFSAEDLAAHPLEYWIHPDDRVGLKHALESDGGPILARHRTSRGAWVAFEFRARLLDDGRAFLGRLLSSATWDGMPARTRGDRTLADVLDSMARVVESWNPGHMCSIIVVDPDNGQISVGAGPSLPVEYNQTVERLQIGPAVGSCGTAAYWNVPVVVADIAKDPLWEGLRDAARLAGLAACWSHPVVAGDGRVLGAMALYSRQPSAPTDDQMQGLETAARIIGIAIEREQLEAQLLQSAKLEALGLLAGGIAHDFNNILSVVAGNMALLQDVQNRTPMFDGLVADILNATDSARLLCDELLAYAGKGEVTLETIDCNLFVQELGELLRVTLSKKADVRYELSDEPLRIRADRSQFRQVLLNLITNASEALNGMPGRIVIRTEAAEFVGDRFGDRRLFEQLDPGGSVRVSVADSGSGMSSAVRARVFEPFFSTKSEGRGLGLAAVQGIVRKHGGAITVESSEGSGSEFSVLLPLTDQVEEGVAQAERQQRGSLKGCRVLLADDHELVRRMIVSSLTEAGCRVTEVQDGQEAVEVFSKRPGDFDSVVLDFSMPRMNGVEAGREIRRQSADMPVIICSGYSEQDIREQTAEIQSVYSVCKEVPDELLAVISEAIQSRSAMR